MSQVWVTGEVLIDLIPDGSDRTPIVGGGPANTAKALAKIGIETQFIDGISTASAFVSEGSFNICSSSSNCLLLKPPVVIPVSLLELLLGVKGSDIFYNLIKVDFRRPA